MPGYWGQNRVNRDSLKDAPKGEWLDGIIEPINSMLDITNLAMLHGITFRDHMYAETHLMKVTVPTDWIAPTLLNSWVNYSFGSGYEVAGYTKNSDGRVYFKGLVSGGLFGVAGFKLPVNYSPALSRHFIVGSNAAVGTVEVRANGDVWMVNGSPSWFTFDGISFDAADRTPVPAGCFPYVFGTKFNAKPIGVYVLDVRDTGSGIEGGKGVDRKYSGIVGAPDWEFTTKQNTQGTRNQIQIRSIPGLSVGRSYEVTLAIIGG